jgi:3-dehydroquinate dehydratase/shikimate dehydrogenase
MSSPLAAYHPHTIRHRVPRVCVPITGANAAEMIEKAETVARDNSFLEFRLDYLPRPADFLAKLKGFIEYHPHLVLIATCRRVKSGGRYRGSVENQIDILARASQLGCQLVDVEIESALLMKPKHWERLKKHSALILSFHDFRGTRNLEKTFAKMLEYPADFFKMVTTANELHDNVELMRFLQSKSDDHAMVGVCMGEQGIISRVLGVRAGSVFTFGAANPGEETAPGQIAARTLYDTFRIDKVDAATRVYGVAGDPIRQSLSPVMMNTAFRRENLNAVYLALHAQELSDLMKCVRDIPIHGLSVTMPYKESILKHLDKTDPISQKVGACNTVIRSQDGKLYGFNTDVAGVVRPIEQRISIEGAKILVLGAGGAARAAVFGLKERGADIYLMNRTAAAGKKLAQQAHIKYLDRAKLAKIKFPFDVIINATPIGMDSAELKGAKHEKPLLTEKELNCRYAFEMVYSPAETPFTKMARAKGIHVIPGSEMFVHQGARQFEIWTGKPAPVEEMHRVVIHAVEQRAAAALATKNGKQKRR